MSVLIYIKKRPEPIKVSYERGQKVKALWADENRPRDNIIDLGDEWSGELREIKAITTEKVEKNPDMKPVSSIDEERKAIEEKVEMFKRLPAEEKAKWLDTELIESYKFHFRFQTGGQLPTDDQIQKVRLFVLKYLQENPEAANVPRDLIKKIR